MTSTTKINLNLQQPNVAVMVFAVQNDKLSRRIDASLWDGSNAWTPPAGALPTIRYLKPDGTGGFYDTLENGAPAIATYGNVAAMTLVEQCTTVPGDVYMELNFYGTDGSKLTTFRWLLRVQQSVIADATIVSSDYYNTLTALASQVAADALAVETAAAAITIPLPVSSGGTGATTAPGALANFGITLPLPVSSGGTGATTAEGARNNLGFAFVSMDSVAFYYNSNSFGIRIKVSNSLWYDVLFTGNGITVSYSFDGATYTTWWSIAHD